MEFFIDAKNEVADDILFFVRQHVPSFKSSTGSINDLDPVIVKRRVAGQTPSLTDVIDWKQSFFLNLICQLPCTLTVSVCKKGEVKSKSSQIFDPSQPSQTDQEKKSGMIAIKRITKKVYASPYKSRMDAKDPATNECSYPLVYYTINDFEVENLHSILLPNDYLCAELSVTIPDNPTSAAYIEATKLVSEITLDQDLDPFPLPPNYTKAILFQGAVSFKALSDVYQQKGIAALNQMRSGWGKKENVQSEPRTEYVLMRGPHGKGQCQGTLAALILVAIQQPDAIMPTLPPTGVLGFLKDAFKNNSNSETSLLIDAPDKLDCSMTFTNVPWQSIAADLLEITKI
jgi:Uncharacterized conserved protein (DUF2045)